jgi:hypothetical protein
MAVLGRGFAHDLDRFSGGDHRRRIKDCAVVLDGTTADVAAEIRFHEGFWIKPCENAPLIVSELAFDEAVPLMASDTSIAGANFKVAHGSRASSLRTEPQLALRSGAN